MEDTIARQRGDAESQLRRQDDISSDRTVPASPTAVNAPRIHSNHSYIVSGRLPPCGQLSRWRSGGRSLGSCTLSNLPLRQVPLTTMAMTRRRLPTDHRVRRRGSDSPTGAAGGMGTDRRPSRGWSTRWLRRRASEVKQGTTATSRITAEAIHTARVQLILRRGTHLDQLTDKLREERVRRVVEPLPSGSHTNAEMRSDDLQYVARPGAGGARRSDSHRQPDIPRVYPARHHVDHASRPHARPAWSFPDQDPVELAFENLCSRFEMYLNRRYRDGNRGAIAPGSNSLHDGWRAL